MTAKILLFTVVISFASRGCLAHRQLDLQPLLEEHHKVFREMALTWNTNRTGLVNYEQSSACFDWYMGDQTVVSTTYNNEFNACMNASAEAKKLLSEQSALERSDLLHYGESICHALSYCESKSAGLEFFQCYYNVSYVNNNALFNISIQAERVQNNLTILYQAVDDTERVCTNEARTKNILSLTESTNNLNSCLRGEWSPLSTTVCNVC